MTDDDVLERLLTERYSCRAFRPEPVDGATLTRLFTLAQRTASWCNAQNWQVHLTSGAATTALGAALTASLARGEGGSDLPWPQRYTGLHAERRRTTGYALYSAVGIERSDHEARAAQTSLNFSFFGAPHVAVITCDRDLGVYGAVDAGGYVSTLLLAAQSLGVAAIAQAAIAGCSGAVRTHLALPDDRVVVCAVSLGHADAADPANSFRTGRAPLSEVLTVVAPP